MIQKIALPAALLFAGGIMVGLIASNAPRPSRAANPCAAARANPCAVRPANPCAATRSNPCAATRPNPCAAG